MKAPAEAERKRKAPISSNSDGGRRRKPLSDCSNILTSPNTSSVSIPKPPSKPVVSSSSRTERIGSSGIAGKPTSNPAAPSSVLLTTSDRSGTLASPNRSSVPIPQPPSEKVLSSPSRRGLIKGSRSSENPSSGSGPLALIPSSPSVSGPNESTVVELEPRSVYTRRKTAEKRKNKGKAIATSPSSSPLIKMLWDMRGKPPEDRDDAVPESRTKPSKKKNHHPSSDQELQEYIRQQKSYFEEVDAFELLEEEVKSAKQLE